MWQELNLGFYLILNSTILQILLEKKKLKKCILSVSVRSCLSEINTSLLLAMTVTIKKQCAILSMPLFEFHWLSNLFKINRVLLKLNKGRTLSLYQSYVSVYYILFLCLYVNTHIYSCERSKIVWIMSSLATEIRVAQPTPLMKCNCEHTGDLVMDNGLQLIPL